MTQDRGRHSRDWGARPGRRLALLRCANMPPAAGAISLHIAADNTRDVLDVTAC